MSRETNLYVCCSLCNRIVEAANAHETNHELRYPLHHRNQKTNKRCKGNLIAVPLIDRNKESLRFTAFSDSMSESIISSVFENLVLYKKNNDGNSPSMRWLQKECEIGSVATVYKALLFLQEQGRVRMSRNKYGTRSIEVVGGQWLSPEEKENMYDDGK